MIISTFLSDSIVVASALWAAMRCRRLHAYGNFASLGFLLIAVAASVGVCRFAGAAQLAPWHQMLSRLAQLMGLPLIALAFAGVQWRWDARLLGWVALSLAPLAIVATGLSRYSSQAWNLPGSVANVVLVSIAILGRRRSTPACFYLVAAVALITGGALMVGPVSDESWGWIRPLDVFHVALSVGHVLIAMAAARLWSRQEA